MRDSTLTHSMVPVLRALAERLQQKPVAQVARMPGVGAVYRVTAHYFDRRAHDSVATLCKLAIGSFPLEMAYDHALNDRIITRTVPRERFEALNRSILTLGFDQLGDMPDLPMFDAVDLWLIERAAGTFVHSVLLAPAQAADRHALLTDAVRTHVPEMVREIR
jgi:hypothetical protein